MMRALLISFILLPSLTYADSFGRTWLGLFSKKEISSDIFLWTEVQARIDNEYFDEQQQLIRLGLLRPISDKHEAGFLYAHVKTGTAQENRLALQLTSNWKEQGFTVRQRLEFRQLEGNDDKSIRYRSLFRYQKSKFLVWDEPFLNITREDWTRNRSFERNRFFLGLNLAFEKTRMELGYLHQYVPRKDTSHQEHVLVWYLFY